MTTETLQPSKVGKIQNSEDVWKVAYLTQYNNTLVEIGS